MNLRALVNNLSRFMRRNDSRRATALKIRVIKASEGSWIVENLKPPHLVVPQSDFSASIEDAARRTQDLGAMPLWKGYSELENYPYEVGRDATRTSDQVRTSHELGNFFTWLVTERRPEKIVEFGTAFGLSGMYFLAGLEAAGQGELLTFEPNEAWADVARKNLQSISGKYVSTIGTFEENIGNILKENERIDIAFIDAIHTSEFVNRLFSLVAERLAPQGLVLFDDIRFSEDMAECWRTISTGSNVKASAEIQGVGLIEMH